MNPPADAIPERYKKLKELSEKATKGPWRKGCISSHSIGKLADSNDPLQRKFDAVIEHLHAVGPSHSIDLDEEAYDKVILDAELLVEARNQIDSLLEDLETACAALEKYKIKEASDESGVSFLTNDEEYKGLNIAREALIKIRGEK